jgi:drug/metabolite transporter (DMT)-like permease
MENRSARGAVAAARPARALAVTLSLAAAFCWSTYYVFVLWATPAATPSAILVYPFVFGGIGYAGWALGRGEGRAFLRLWRSPSAYLRIGLLVGMQVGVLAATYLTGPVDAALLSLIGDVVVTPIIVVTILGIHRDHIATPLFAAGLVLCLVGGSLAIAGGRRLEAIPPIGWLVVPAVPIFVAFFFLLTARENRRAPAGAVLSQSMLGAGLVLALVSPLLPGGSGGLAQVPLVPLVLLVACGVTSFFIADVFYFEAIGRVGLVIPPMLMTGIPVFTLILSATLLGIGLPLLAVLGIPIAVVGGLLTLRGGSAPSGASAGPPPTGS